MNQGLHTTPALVRTTSDGLDIDRLDVGRSEATMTGWSLIDRVSLHAGQMAGCIRRRRHRRG